MISQLKNLNQVGARKSLQLKELQRKQEDGSIGNTYDY